MARFVFSLEVVLEQRERAEKQKQRALGELLAQRVSIEDRIREVQRRGAGDRAQMRAVLAPGRVDLAAARHQTSSALHSVVLLQRAVIELAGLNKRIERARHDLMLATIARKAVAALRERRYAQWKREQDRAENAALDDLNIMRAGREQGVEA